MYNLNSNRRWKRVIALNSMRSCNRASRRAAARIQAALTPNGPAPTVDSPSVATVQRVYTRPYIVRETGTDSWHMVRSAENPQGYAEFKGPFKTTRAAQFGVNRPLYSVAECEKYSKQSV